MVSIKKLVAAVLAGIMLCGMVGFAAENGADEATLYVIPNAARSSITVIDEIEGATKANTTVILRYIKSLDNEGNAIRETILTDFTKSYWDGDVVKFNFGEIFLPDDLESGTYRIEVSCEDLDVPLWYEHRYARPEEVWAALKKMKYATEANVCSVLEENEGILAVNLEDYKIIKADRDEDGISSYAAIMVDDATMYDGLPETCDKNNIAELEAVAAKNGEVLTKLYKKCKEASAVGRFLISKNAGDLDTWYDKFFKDAELPFSDEGDETYKVTTVLDKVKADEKGKTELARRIALATGNLTLTEIKEHLFDSALLSQIVIGTGTEVETLLNKYDRYFKDGVTGIDWETYNSLAKTERADVIDEVAGTSYATMAKAVQGINAAINDVGDGSEESSVSSQSGRPVYKPTTPTSTTSPGDESSIFTDIAEVDWAKDAIKYLYGKSIVSGRPDGRFAPNDNVTRAEFIKMIMLAMGVEITDSETPFGDVSNDSWYAPYISAAYKAEILMGDEDGNCSPEANITRQDMATILFRAIGAVHEDVTVDFSDAANISEYALNAVSYFTQQGIIQGMGDGRFGAMENATRAQTAVIIYRMMVD